MGVFGSTTHYKKSKGASMGLRRVFCLMILSIQINFQSFALRRRIIASVLIAVMSFAPIASAGQKKEPDNKPIDQGKPSEISEAENSKARAEAKKQLLEKISAEKERAALSESERKKLKLEERRERAVDSAEHNNTLKADEFVDYTLGMGPEAGGQARILGATGAIGFVPQKEPRKQILIDEVVDNGPAGGGPGSDKLLGKLRQHDVIVGIASPRVEGLTADGYFEGACHIVLSRAIEEAGKKTNNGKLVLKVWRPETEFVVKGAKRPEKVRKVLKPVKSASLEVALDLPVLGSTSEMSPWNCERTEKLIDLASQAIVKRRFNSRDRKGVIEENQYNNRIDYFLDALGLLATGEEKYLSTVRDFAHSHIERCSKIDIMDPENSGGGTWYCAYLTLFLSEYYLVTKDEAVLPAIRGNARFLGMGVSGVGTWSHGVAAVRYNGMYGPSCAYGAMNQASLVACMSLVLAKKCGIEDPYVDKAIELCLNQYPYYVDKGTIPYGEHLPYMKGHDSNGKNSIAAVLYDIAGRKKEAEYFTHMTIMSHRDRHGGHTGDYFAWQWGVLGAARGGQDAAVAFCNSTRYWTELGQNYDGYSTYEPVLQGDPGKYTGWSSTGSRLMQYCLPRKALYITGKGDGVVSPVVGAKLQTLLETEGYNFSSASDSELLKLLKHCSPIVRNDAAEQLGLRSADMAGELLAMLDSENRFARYGACKGLLYAGGAKREAAFDSLMRIAENDPDVTMRYYAINAMVKTDMKYKGERTLGSPPTAFAERLLKLVSQNDVNGDEKMGLQREICRLLFGDSGILKNKKISADVNKNILQEAVSELMMTPHGAVRGDAASALTNFSKEELEPYWGVLYYSMTHAAPGGVMEGGTLNTVGNQLMAKYHVKEGVPLTIWWFRDRGGWGAGNRMKSIGGVVHYGKHLEPLFPFLESRQERFIDVKRTLAKLKSAHTPELSSIEQRIKEFGEKIGKPDLIKLFEEKASKKAALPDEDDEENGPKPNSE